MKAFFLHGTFQLMSNWAKPLSYYIKHYSCGCLEITVVWYFILVLAIFVVLHRFVSFFFSRPSSHCPMTLIHFTGKEKYPETQDKGEKLVLLHGIVGFFFSVTGYHHLYCTHFLANCHLQQHEVNGKVSLETSHSMTY